MAAEPHGHGKTSDDQLLPASSSSAAAAKQVHLKVYHRCTKRQLRALDAKIASLEIQLHDELSKKSSSSSSGSQEGGGIVVTDMQDEAASFCSQLLDEIERTTAKRDAIYAAAAAAGAGAKGEGDGNGNGDALPPAPAAGMECNDRKKEARD